MPVAGSRQFAEQRLLVSKIGSGEAFSEPAVDRREEVAGLGVATLVAAEPGEAGGGPRAGCPVLRDARRPSVHEGLAAEDLKQARGLLQLLH